MFITGYVDGVQDTEVFGWAVDTRQPDQAVKLQIYVDEEPLTDVLAIEHRADIAKLFGTDGLNGFRVSVPSSFLRSPVVTISIRSEAGTHLGNSPLRLNSELLARRPSLSAHGAECLFFMHIQKTAGTAFRKALIQNYRRSEVLLVYPDPPGIWDDRVRQLPTGQKRSFRCVAGHFMYGIHEVVEMPGKYVTIVRHPIARVSSHYHHMIRASSPHVKSEHGDIISLERLLEMQRSRQLDNMIVRCFAGETGPCGTIGSDCFELAMINLERFAFVGHQEQSQAAWRHLSSMLGFPQTDLETLNTGPAHLSNLRPETKRVIEHYCKYDMMFYERLLRKYPL